MLATRQVTQAWGRRRGCERSDDRMLCEMRDDVIGSRWRRQHDLVVGCDASSLGGGGLTEYDPLIFVKRPLLLDRDYITDPIFYRNPTTLDRDPICDVS
jgi:hypothetical protein